jgi:hypothetical protein
MREVLVEIASAIATPVHQSIVDVVNRFKYYIPSISKVKKRDINAKRKLIAPLVGHVIEFRASCHHNFYTCKTWCACSLRGPRARPSSRAGLRHRTAKWLGTVTKMAMERIFQYTSWVHDMTANVRIVCLIAKWLWCARWAGLLWCGRCAHLSTVLTCEGNPNLRKYLRRMLKNLPLCFTELAFLSSDSPNALKWRRTNLDPSLSLTLALSRSRSKLKANPNSTKAQMYSRLKQHAVAYIFVKVLLW